MSPARPIPCPPHRLLATSPRAFSLVEVIVTIVIAALIAAATTTVVAQMIDARDASRSLEASARRAATAVDAIAADIYAAVRSDDLLHARVQIVSAGIAQSDRDELLLLTRRRQPLRELPENPEGSDFEAAYKLLDDPPHAVSLWRRIDPALDPYQDAGGVASRVARHIAFLKLEAYDGHEWFDAWDSDLDGYPHAIRVTVGATDDANRRLAVARRVVALDRVPIPPPLPAGAGT